MVQMGIPDRWCGWIRGILESARSSVLVNGSPTFKFQCSKGIRQGDPISPFLFILAMEALSCIVEKARNLGAFAGIKINFAGLKINLSKSNIFAIGVENGDLDVTTSHIELARWKGSLLSIGGRLTLINSVMERLPGYSFSLYKAPVQVINDLESKIRNFLWGDDEEIKKLHWVAWDRVASPRKLRGLGLSKLKLINASLLTKWGWRFLSGKDKLWAKVVEAIHVT
ncbi:uncharacterized protein LOC110866461 [Helianthus annuus]|uniref:uncharacterized protein LOC110866461 n=1 Tax=Helianthus annuus TaxID=4232 RepID=UPI000B90A1AF|nr:uncharacterized protein LOC110866461 [Helianthus annuus]